MRTQSAVFIVLSAGAVWGADLEPMSSAELCGSCHRAIHEAWKSSAHAQAMESRMFQDALELVESDFGTAAKSECLGCHTPIGVHLGDKKLKQKVTWEGVTCDYCHSMRSVSFQAVNPQAKLEYSLVKSGPLKDASSVAHGTVFSPVHTSSEVCAPCHEYTNRQGFAVLTTYSEWKQSSHHAKGVHCQSCHMGRIEGAVVDPRVKSRAGAEVNLHEMPGGHSIDQLTKALRVNLTTKRSGDEFEIEVLLANVGAGHHVPTGSPMRRLVLDVRADAYRGDDFSAKRAYERVVADSAGNPLKLEHVAFFKGAKVLSDTRIAPGEKRTERFSFAVAEGVPVQVKATLTYFYSPMARTEAQEKLVFRNISRFVK